MLPEDKAQQGDPLVIPARVWNSMLDAADDWNRRHRLGVGGAGPVVSVNPCVVMVSNDSAADRAAGEALEVTDKIITTLDKGHLWLSGALRTGNKSCGILLEPLKDGKIGPLQLDGVCLAQVDINDEDHTHAYVKSSDANPQSNFGGTMEIVYKPSGTGLKTCIVKLLGKVTTTRKAILDVDIDYGDFGAASFYVGGVDVGSEDVYFDWMPGATSTLDAGTECLVQWFDDQERWSIVNAEC